MTATHNLTWLEAPLRQLQITTTYDLIGDLHASVHEMRGARAGKAANKQQKENENEN